MRGWLIVYLLFWLGALNDFRLWKNAGFPTDSKTGEGLFFSIWIVSNVFFLFFYAVWAFSKVY